MPARSGNWADASAIYLTPVTITGYDDGYRVAAPVGSFPANPLGLHDMGGNVFEWMTDRYSIYVVGPDHVSTDPVGPRAGESYVIRGASWLTGKIPDLRLAARDSGKQRPAGPRFPHRTLRGVSACAISSLLLAALLTTSALAIDPPKPRRHLLRSACYDSACTTAPAPVAARPDIADDADAAAAKEAAAKPQPKPGPWKTRCCRRCRPTRCPRSAARALQPDRESARGLSGLVPDRHLRIP